MSGESSEAAVEVKVRPKAQRRPRDRDVAEIARQQHGVVTLAQVERLGLSGRALRHRADSGRMLRVHRGVYAPGPLGREGRWMAALCAVADGALLSHRSAAALWGICADDPALVHVTLPQRAFRAPSGIVAHSGSTLRSDDRDMQDGIPCTALPRTLIDLAGRVDRRTLAHAVDRAETLRLFDLVAIQEALVRERGRRGVRALTEVLATYAGPSPTRSQAEEHMRAIVICANLPKPEINVWIPLPRGNGYRPDFLWRAERVIVEVDSRTYHARRAAFEHDRKRDRELALAGYTTHRYAASELTRSPRQVARELRALLAVH